MRYLSVCSGIEAASVAWHPLGWEPVAFSEVDAFPSAVLKHHYPAVPNWGDMTKFQEWPDADVDVLVGGTPCQSFSVAGLRKGLDDPRGSLMLVYLAIARRYRPRWVVWENVPGVLSADGGRAFGSLLGGLAELGYGFAYRVLDAQYFGVAQRRKRVFVVGHLGDWRRAAAVLFERESLSGHPAPRRASGQVAPTELARRAAGGGFGTDFDCDGGLIARRWLADVAPTLDAHFGDKQGQENQHINGGCGLFVPAPPIFATSGQANTAFTEDIALALNATHEQSYIAGTLRTRRPGETGQGADVDLIVPVVSPALNTASGGHHAPDTRAYAVEVTHSLRAEGFDASEDGTGRGTPLVPVAYALNSHAGTADGDRTNRSHANGGPVGFGLAENIAYALRAGRQQTVAHAFDARQSNVIQYGDKSGPLDTNGSSIGVMTLAIRGRADGAQLEVRDDGTSNAILTPSGGRGGIGVGAVAFSAKDYGADAGDIAPTLRAGGHTTSHANGGVMPAVAFAQNQRDEVRTMDTAGALAAEPGMRQQTNLAVTHETLYSKGINHASTQETYAATLLRALREEVGAEAFTQWGLGILDSLLPAEVLRSRLHGCGIRLSANFSRRWLVYHALSRPEAHSEGLVLAMREAECEGRASQGWRPPEQLARELGAYLSELSQPGAQATRFMRDLWQASEGLGLLREALSAVQEVGRSARLQGEPAHAALQVRRLTVEECEFLQGFPRGYTAIPYRGKPAADGPRYKALGNSMAVPVMRWIGERIAQVEAV